MSATSGHNLRGAGSHADARQLKLRRILESHGPLTRARLLELAHAESWHTEAELVLERAERAGRIRRLGDELFEATPGRAR